MVHWIDLRYLQSQWNGIKDNDDVKFLLAQIKKLQNTAEVRTLISDQIALSTKSVMQRKK